VAIAYKATVTESAIAIGASSTWHELEPKESAHVQFSRDAGTGTLDTMILSVYASTDGGTTVDTVPIAEWWVAPGTPMPKGSFVIAGVKFFRVTMTRNGATDPITVTLRFALDGGIA